MTPLLRRRLNYCLSCVLNQTSNKKRLRAAAAMMISPIDRTLKVVYMTVSAAFYMHCCVSWKSRSSGNFSWCEEEIYLESSPGTVFSGG
jgi:hypothetical protein